MIAPTILNNRYQAIRVLGSGGFGETFLAEDTQMPSGRRCVIKRLKPVVDNPQIYQLVQERFQREAAILEELGDSSNQIPRLYAYFSEHTEFYLVQEYVEGQTLTQKLEQQGRLSESQLYRKLLKFDERIRVWAVVFGAGDRHHKRSLLSRSRTEVLES